MAVDVSALIGSAQVAGTRVSPRGVGKKAMAGGAGMAGGLIPAVIGAAAGGKAGRKVTRIRAESQTPRFGAHGFLALSEDELTLVRMKQGLVSPQPVEVVARVPRSDIASIELRTGLPMRPLTVAFANGESWLLEVSRLADGQAEDLVRVLGG